MLLTFFYRFEKGAEEKGGERERDDGRSGGGRGEITQSDGRTGGRGGDEKGDRAARPATPMTRVVYYCSVSERVR